MATSTGHAVSIGNRSFRIPSGWSVTQKAQITFCGSYALKQRVALIDGGNQRLEDIPTEGNRTAFNGRLFSGHLEEGVIPAPFLDRVFFRRQPHYRFEWVIQHDDVCLVAVYLSDLDDDRTNIKTRIEQLLDAIEIVAS